MGRGGLLRGLMVVMRIRSHECGAVLRVIEHGSSEHWRGTSRGEGPGGGVGVVDESGLRRWHVLVKVVLWL